MSADHVVGGHKPSKEKWLRGRQEKEGAAVCLTSSEATRTVKYTGILPGV